MVARKSVLAGADIVINHEFICLGGRLINNKKEGGINMIKKIFLAAVLLMVLFQGAAHAFEAEGEIIFKDTLYGTAIGALLGTAVYLADQDNFAQKVSSGILIGAVGGLIYGFVETDSFVEIEKDKIKIAVPTPKIEKNKDDIRYTASLLKAKF